MAYEVFDDVPWASFKTVDEWPSVAIACDGPYMLTRRTLSPYPRRRWVWNLKRLSDLGTSVDERNAVAAQLLSALKVGATAFLIRDPKDVRQENVSLGTGDGSTVTFAMTSTPSSAYYPHYPFSDSTTIVKVNGSTIATANRTIDRDARTVTLSVAPTLGHAVTISYDFYRLAVILGQGLEWEKGDDVSILTDVAPEIVEIVRE